MKNETMTKNNPPQILAHHNTVLNPYLRWLLAARSKDKNRPVLNKVYADYSADGTVYLVCTDGRRMHVLELYETYFNESFSWDGSESFLLDVTQNKVSNVIFQTCSEDLTFPNWKNVFEQHMTFDKHSNKNEITCKGEHGVSTVLIKKALTHREHPAREDWSLSEKFVADAIGKGTLYRPSNSRESYSWTMHSKTPLEPLVLEESEGDRIKAYAVIMPMRAC